MNGDKTTKVVRRGCFLGPKITADIAVMIAGTTTETAHGMTADATAKKADRINCILTNIPCQPALVDGVRGHNNI